MLELVNKRRANLKKNGKKGFTLVEVIVVLVILAILAAILVPAMTGWIKKANEKTVLVEARSALLALQTVASENYNPKGNNAGEMESADVTEAETLAALAAGSIDDVARDNNSKITKFTYTTPDFVVTYANNKFTVSENNSEKTQQ